MNTHRINLQEKEFSRIQNNIQKHIRIFKSQRDIGDRIDFYNGNSIDSISRYIIDIISDKSSDIIHLSIKKPKTNEKMVHEQN